MVPRIITGLELEGLTDSKWLKGWFIPPEKSATHALSVEST
jgi:hypothetical protein